MPSDIEHWHINAIVYKDRVEETHFISDPAINVRRRQQTKVWQVERSLGRGGFGEVRLERNKEDGNARAVKRIAMISTTLTNSECEKELKALLEFSKPKSREAAVFVDFFGWFKDGSDVFLAMEYVPLGDLEKNVSENSGKVPEAEAQDITEQILSGLKLMHAESFAHRDLKPQNVLVVNGPPRWWVKLADFGLSKRLTDTTAYYTRGGTQSYMAPEVLNYLDAHVTSSEYTNAVDLWAVGCIVYRLITGVVPFPPGTSLVKYCEDKSLFPYDALFDSGVKRDGSRFIRQLLVTDPKDRPSASQALQHQWIILGTNIASGTSDISRPSQEASGLSEPTLSDIRYNTVSHDGLKSRRSISPSHTTSSQSLVPYSSDNSKVSANGMNLLGFDNHSRKHRSSKHSTSSSRHSGIGDSSHVESHRPDRKSRESESSLKAFFSPSSPNLPASLGRHDSGIASASFQSKQRSNRTPVEQVAHEKRKRERRVVVDEPSSPNLPIEPGRYDSGMSIASTGFKSKKQRSNGTPEDQVAEGPAAGEEPEANAVVKEEPVTEAKEPGGGVVVESEPAPPLEGDDASFEEPAATKEVKVEEPASAEVDKPDGTAEIKEPSDDSAVDEVPAAEGTATEAIVEDTLAEPEVVIDQAIVEEPEPLPEVAEEPTPLDAPSSPKSDKQSKHRSSRHSTRSSHHSSSKDRRSFKAFFTSPSPKTPKPIRHDSGISTGSASSHSKNRRTPEEQATHDKRKAERRTRKEQATHGNLKGG